MFFEFYESALESVDVTICKVQNPIILLFIKNWKARVNRTYR